MRALALALAALAAAACGSTGDPAGSAASAPACDPGSATSTAAVSLQGMQFVPACVTVAAGTTVTFTDQDAGTIHNVAAGDGSFTSPNLGGPGQTFLHTFAAAGTVQIQCTYHAAMGMRATVLVR